MASIYSLPKSGAEHQSKYRQAAAAVWITTHYVHIGYNRIDSSPRGRPGDSQSGPVEPVPTPSAVAERGGGLFYETDGS